MIPKNIGYIICESDITSAEVTNVVGNTSGKIIAEGIIQTADERNRNGRFYPKEELFPQLVAPRTLELLNAGYLRAEMGHPLSKELIRQQTIDDTRTCARFLKLWTEGLNVWARFTGTNNEHGKAFMADLAEGCKPAWSLRALGSIENTRRGAEVRNLKVITWDQVIYPSHPGAYTQRIVSESAGVRDFDTKGESLIIPLTNKQVLNYIRSESANLKFMTECFDFMYDSININESNSTVTLTGKDGDIMVVNLETHIHNEIMNYCSEVASYFEK
jgi:hypothetical protein